MPPSKKKKKNAAKQNAHSFLRPGLVDLPFSLGIFLATNAFGDVRLRIIPEFGKEKCRCYSQQNPYLLNESHTLLSSSLISELLMMQRNCTFISTSKSPTLAQCLAQSSCSINSGELHLIPSPPALEFVKSRNIHWNLILHSSLPMYTQACHLVFSST